MAEASDPTKDDDDAPKKGGKGGLVVALVGALVAGGGGFAATYIGVFDSLLGGGDDKSAAYEKGDQNFSFVALDPILISLGPEARASTLKFTAQLEVVPEAAEAVTALKPRILDVLNGYLRAVSEAELEDPAALSLLRAQMLRRIQIVTGGDMVRDLLVAEFIMN